jgi:hypothetical protein
VGEKRGRTGADIVFWVEGIGATVKRCQSGARGHSTVELEGAIFQQRCKLLERGGIVRKIFWECD